MKKKTISKKEAERRAAQRSDTLEISDFKITKKDTAPWYNKAK